jgi:hypothetical protein
MTDLSRFKFIGHALRGDGPFRPTVTYDHNGRAVDNGPTYLIRYPREDDTKFAVRNQVAFYESPLQRVTSRFVSHLAKRAVTREIPTPLMDAMADNIDLKGNDADVFWQDFMVQAKARGSMLMLVDMPAWLGEDAAAQLSDRRAPYWTPVYPESLHQFTLTETGKFETVSFFGTYYGDPGDPKKCIWTFDTAGWKCTDMSEKETFDEGEHPLGETPVIIFTETGDFPCFGSFAPVADISKRLFNMHSELDEILRSQTFSLLTMQVPEGSAYDQMVDAASAAGETISTHNLMLHTGQQPGFIAPPSGPADIYMRRIQQLENRIRDIGLEVATVDQSESGIAMQRRFELINAELSRFAERVEDFERRAWALSAKWLGVSTEPSISWPRDFNVADVVEELDLLQKMQATGMGPMAVREQKQRVVSTQFDALEDEKKAALVDEVNNEASAL